MNKPLPRYDHGMIKVTDDEFYIFGGSVSDQGQGFRCNQIWKFDIINKNLHDLTTIINDIFLKISEKIRDYEKVSQEKIERYRNYFFENFKKFFDKASLK